MAQFSKATVSTGSCQAALLHAPYNASLGSDNFQKDGDKMDKGAGVETPGGVGFGHHDFTSKGVEFSEFASRSESSGGEAGVGSRSF